VRLKNMLGLAAGVTIAAGLLTASPASAASLPCNLGSSGNSASVTCYSGSSYTWRLVVDCADVSSPMLPRTVSTVYGDWHTGDGTEAISCGGSLRANAHLEAR
jgi:hypothetical protein